MRSYSLQPEHSIAALMYSPSSLLACFMVKYVRCVRKEIPITQFSFTHALISPISPVCRSPLLYVETQPSRVKYVWHRVSKAVCPEDTNPLASNDPLGRPCHTSLRSRRHSVHSENRQVPFWSKCCRARERYQEASEGRKLEHRRQASTGVQEFWRSD